MSGSLVTKRPYLTAPVPTKTMPGGVPFIVSNEVAERFSYYGMRAILVVFMTEYLRNSAGDLDVMSEAEANSYYHLFGASVYFFPFMGALLSDIFLGKYRTILSLSIVYCLGHLALALNETTFGLAVGLTLIAIGSGGIKPCVSAHVGDQFGKTNKHLIETVYIWFYFAINVGSFSSSLLTPILLHNFGPSVAFGVPGALMFLATFVFWLGRHRFVHIPPSGTQFVKETFGPDGRRAIGSLAVIYLFVAVFWCLFDQTGSSWIHQADKMDLTFFGYEFDKAQIQAANPIMVLLFIPIFNTLLYPAIERFVDFTPMRRISVGLFITSGSFAVCALVAHKIDAGETPSGWWQILAYAILTAGELMVSITCLEFSYTQAPKTMKSVIMAVFFLSITLGNLAASGVNKLIEDGTIALEGPAYFWFFTGAMFAAAVAFIPVAIIYKPRTYIQDEVDPDAQALATGTEEQ